MTISNTKTTNANGSVYNSLTITSGKTSYNFLKVTGSINYVNISNKNSPFKTMGKQFDSFDHAQTNYKNPKLCTKYLVFYPATISLKYI